MKSLTCAHCGREFLWSGGPGRRPRYCRDSCRWAAHHDRQAARGYRTGANRPVMLPPELAARLDAWCAEHERTRAKVVARAVAEYLDRQQ